MTLCQQLARTGLFVCGIALVLCSVFPATTAAHEEDCILGHDTEHYDIDDQLLQARSGRLEIDAMGETLYIELESTSVCASGVGHAEHFSGTVEGEADSAVRLSFTARGMVGSIRRGEEWIFVEPSPGAHGSNLAQFASGPSVSHRVFDDLDLNPAYGAGCAAHEGHGLAEGLGGVASGGFGVPSAEQFEVGAAESLRVIELYAEIDTAWYRLYGENSLAEVESIIHAVNGVYEAQLGLTIQIVGSRVYTSGDPYGDREPLLRLTELLQQFALRGRGEEHDLIHLFTGSDLTGGVIGVAIIGGICDSRLHFGLSQDFGHPSLMPILVAHEIGHNLGSQHDTTGQQIMAPAISPDSEFLFSERSADQMLGFLDTVDCLATVEVPDGSDPEDDPQLPESPPAPEEPEVPTPPAPPAPAPPAPAPTPTPPTEAGPLLRGDANGDGAVNMWDVTALMSVVHMGAASDCLDACDVDDNGYVNAMDILALLNTAEQQMPLPAPYPNPGNDPTSDNLGCSR